MVELANVLSQLRFADFSSPFSAISTALAGIVVLLVHAAPAATLFFYNRFSGTPMDTRVCSTWEALLRNLKGRSYYYPVFLVRRLGLAYLLVFLDIQGLIQTLFASALAVVSVAFTLRERPGSAWRVVCRFGCKYCLLPAAVLQGTATHYDSGHRFHTHDRGKPFKPSEPSENVYINTPRSTNGDPDILVSAENTRPVFSGFTHSGDSRKAKNF
jgi:hypothetical protein